MSFTIPDKGEGADIVQSIAFQEQFEMLVDAIDGTNCVLSGGAVTPSSLLTVAIAKAAVLSNKVLFAVAATTKTVGTADVTNPRLDLIVVDSAGAVQVRAGTAAANPKPPNRTANDVVLAIIYVPALLGTVLSGDITDQRAMRSNGPICIYRTTVAETTNTSSALIEALNKANAGVTIPNGLFLAGKILRVCMGGTIKTNSGTPTVTLTIKYGGSTIFADTSASFATSANLHAWRLEFEIAAQANADQAMAGLFQIVDPVAAPTNPTTGVGDAWAANTQNQEVQTVIGGSSAADSDAGDRLLSVGFTISVSNAANELIVELATVELI